MAHWSPAVSKVHLRSSYSDLLAAARNHERCRFWLIDLSAHLWCSDEDKEWYNHTFAPLAVRALGHPIFIAYAVTTGQAHVLTDPAVALMQQVCAVYDFYPCFFTNSLAALDWLRCQQEYDPAPGEGPAVLGQSLEDGG